MQKLIKTISHRKLLSTDLPREGRAGQQEENVRLTVIAGEVVREVEN